MCVVAAISSLWPSSSDTAEKQVFVLIIFVVCDICSLQTASILTKETGQEVRVTWEGYV